MLTIAKEITPNALFIQGDMRRLQLREKFDAILITGKTFTYMITNEDVMNALHSINLHLKRKGLLIFDNYNAAKMIQVEEPKE